MSARENILRWRADPVAFVRDNFGVEPDLWQADALRSFGEGSGYEMVSMQACAGPGKSAVLAWMGWYFLSCFGAPGHHPKGYCVSVTGDNLRSNLWPEFAKWQGKSAYLKAAFTWGAERIYANDHKPTWFLEARSWPKTANADEQGGTLSGLHGRFVAVFIDESGSIPMTVSRAAQQIFTDGPEFGRVAQAGNPLSKTGMLYGATIDSRWRVIRITGDPDDPKRSPRIPADRARASIEANGGRSNPWVQAYILGEFPDVALDRLLSINDMERASHHNLPEDMAEPMILGLDVGLSGDPSVLYPRRGRLLFEPTVMRGQTATLIAATVVRQAAALKAQVVFVDAGGPGLAVIDVLRSLGQEGVVPVYFGGGADDSMRYVNKRAEMYARFAAWIKEGGAIGRHPARELFGDVTEPEVEWNIKGQMKLEDKDDIRKRLGRSPDYGDGAVLTFAYPVAARRADSPEERYAYQEVDRLQAQHDERSEDHGFGMRPRW